MNENLKWCAIQPLTGGMYLGTEKVIGHPAEFILSYPGVGEPIYNKKTGELIGGGNEYHLMTYLDKVGRRPEYKVFDRTMFQNDRDINPTILNTRWTLNENKDLDYSNMDLCVAVPVCSGLSTATTGTEEVKAIRNCNMIYISTYALKVIKPKIYIFENAPTFLSKRGDYVRNELEKLAAETDYSVVYYRTDTILHNNCQSRKRTFIIFFKKEFAPQMGYEKLTRDIESYFKEIPEDATQQDPLRFDIVNYVNKYCIEYFKDLYGGSTWREKIPNVFNHIIKNKMYDEILDYINKRTDIPDDHKAGMKKFFDHVKYKLSLNKGFYHAFPYVPIDHIPAIMFKSMEACLSPFRDTLLSPRECLHLMGHPHDFELQGNVLREFPKIGQNVPVRTAYWIVSEALRAFNRDNDLDEPKRLRIFDNIKQEELKTAA